MACRSRVSPCEAMGIPQKRGGRLALVQSSVDGRRCRSNVNFEKNSGRILLENAIEDEFLLDTGATETLVSARIAKCLRLPSFGAIEVGLADGRTSLCFKSRVSIFIGGKWLVVPCIIPYPLDASARAANLLGMGGHNRRASVLSGARGVGVIPTLWAGGGNWNSLLTWFRS